MNIVTAHPKLVTFGIGSVGHNQVFTAPSFGCGDGVGIKVD